MIERLAILNQLKTDLAGITTANGYLTDFGNISIWKSRPEPKANRVAVWIRDIKTDHVYDNGYYQLFTIEIHLSCIKSDNHTYINNMIFDLYKNLDANESNFTSQFNFFQWLPVGDELALETFDREIAEATVTIQAKVQVSEHWVASTKTDY